MKVINPLQMNDWAIRRFLKVVLAIQLAVWGVIGLDAIGLQIPLIRQFIGFIYLTFIPGILVLRSLKLHKLGNIETLLYTVGLSIATLMFTGLLMNTIYPLFGISGPISITPLIITISAVVLVLCVISYIRDKNFSDPSFIGVGDVLSPPALFLCLIPFLVIFGTYLINFHHSNILLMLLIIILALIVLLIGFDKFIPKNLYPLAVFVIAISLLFYRSLISLYIIGYDIHYEYYISNLVMMNSYWDSTIFSPCNAMLSIVMLAPIFSDICGMSLTWVFKTIYPLLFSLVPLGLYRVFQKQTDDKIAFLAIFFFMSMYIFYSPMPRQNIAEFYLVLLILPMIDRNIDNIKRSVFFIVFGISLAVSHYGTSYIYMFCLISAWLILVSGENLEMQKLMRNFHSKFGRKSEKAAGNSVPSKVDRTISSTFVLVFIIFTLTWYMYVSSSSAFNTIVYIGDHIASSIVTDFLNPEAAQGLDIILKKTITPLHDVAKYLHLLSQFFIFVGVLTLINRKEMKFEREYEAFSLMNFAICFGGITLPYFASALNTERLYHITLIFLAPLCVIGGLTVFRVISKAVKVSWTDQRVKSSLKVLSMFFAIFLLFNTGWVYEVAKDNPSSFSLNSTSDYPRFNDQEVLGAKWLHDVKSSNKMYADVYRWLLLSSFEWGEVRAFPADGDEIRKDSYIYLGTWNVVEGEVMVRHKIGVSYIGEYINSEYMVNDVNKIYANGGAQVYY
jgi:uncharacterized membrane protein